MRDRMARLVADGKTEQEAIAAKAFADYDATLGVNEQASQNFIRVVYIRWCHSRAEALVACVRPERFLTEVPVSESGAGKPAAPAYLVAAPAILAIRIWSGRLPEPRPCEIYHRSGDFLPICVRQMLS
jgi:hypothetical protein